jgi:hypothetical protein
VGALFLYHRETDIDTESVRRLYSKKGFSDPVICDIGNYKLWIYRKQLVRADNFVCAKSGRVFACGTLFYKGLSYTESLQKLLDDFSGECIDPSALFGNYILLFHKDRESNITLSVDPAFIKNIYFDRERKVLSSDFLAILESIPGYYSLNRIALVENIITGSLISPETYANEIQKLDRLNFTEIEKDFPGVKARLFTPEIRSDLTDFTSAVEDANLKLDEYFSSAAAISDQYGANIGITGGFDSRLLLMHARKHIKNLSCNSFWRTASQEYINARLLSEAAGLSFSTFEKKPFTMPSDESIPLIPFLFFDGQVRSQNRWDEEFNQPEYNSRLISGSCVGFHGCGGEQYRNADRYSRTVSLESFIRHEWLFRQTRNIFLNRRLQSAVFTNVERKIIRLLQPQKKILDLEAMKRFQNEIWNTSNRTTRVNVLNQQQFYFAPFTEYSISHSAYGYVSYLGPSFRFQVEMMKRVDPALAAVTNNYGFSISDGEPLKMKLFSTAASLLPRPVLYKMYFLFRKTHRNMPENYSEPIHPVISGLEGDIDILQLRKNGILGPALKSFNFMLHKTKLRY